MVVHCNGCGPVPRPSDAYTEAPNLLEDLAAKREEIHSFRIIGRVDHFGEEHRIQGKTFLFAELPGRLRIELVSPFGNPLSVLTVNDSVFALHDLREGRFFVGPAEPCNIARLVQLPLPPSDVIRILIGHSPLIEGVSTVTWNKNGYYDVNIRQGNRIQQLRVGKDHNMLPLLQSRLEDSGQIVFDIAYEKWRRSGGVFVPHEIRVKMPNDNVDLLIRYDDDGVELNVEMPDDAWVQSPPAGIQVEQVDCDS
jgi:hypothetical protein